jgi:hypothetical protein
MLADELLVSNPYERIEVYFMLSVDVFYFFAFKTVPTYTHF